MKNKSNEISSGRRGERGAALVTALLVSMLLLGAGGALIVTTSMAATNAVDATAEEQAYYAADSGLQMAINVMRHNKPSNNPANFAATFRNFVCGLSTTCTNGGGNLSQWLTYTNGRVQLSATPALSFELSVTDPGLNAADTLAANYQPRFLLVRSVGHGPKGATKVLEMMVDRFKFAYDAPAPLVLRESKNANPHVSLTPGPGQPNLYSGTDVSNPLVTKPAVGVGDTTYLLTSDLTVASLAMSGETMTGGVGAIGNATTPWPPIVADAGTTAATVAELKSYADSTTCPGNSQALSGFTFIEGDCSLGPQNSGSGFLVVTGTLTVSGNFNYSGLVFALGTGKVVRNGGGGGTIEGGILAANYTGNGSTGFGQVIFDTSGGGNSKIKYNSKAIENGLSLLGPRLLGVVER